MNVNIRFAIVLLVGLACQAVIVPLIAIGPVKPDLVLIIVAVFGFLDGPAQGAVGGFLGGFLQDLLAARSIGLEALVKTLIGYFSGQVERTILGNSALMPMLAIGGVSVASQTLYAALASIVGEPVPLIRAMRIIILPSALYTAVIGLVVWTRLTRLLSAEREATVFK